MEKIIMYPSMGISHLAPMLELAKLLNHHLPSTPISLLLTGDPPLPPSSSSALRHLLSSATAPSSITFQYLPNPPSLSHLPVSSAAAPSLSFLRPRLNLPHLHLLLSAASASHDNVVLIVDFFNTSAQAAALALCIPLYYYFPISACALSATLFFPSLHRAPAGRRRPNDVVHVPGLPPIPADHMPNSMHDRSTDIYRHFLDLARAMPHSAGVIVNTFEMFEKRVIKAINAGLCVSGDDVTPPIFCIGPLVGEPENSNHECIAWLDAQPKRSVVFLCFGSMGEFSSEQMREMAVGLERSGHRFLWAVREPASALPEGFEERTRGRGKVCDWVPQVDVLSHAAVGGFVTHCGWNSVLEAVCAGVPLIAWPLFAEQRLNKVFLVEEARVALPLAESEGGLVSAAELEDRIRELMGWETGVGMRERMEALREGAKVAVGDGGSSTVAIDDLTRRLKGSVVKEL